MTRIKNTEAAPTELEARTNNGPHKGWGTFDNKFEGARFQLLHDLVSAETFDIESARVILSELEDFAQSYGYGTADNVLHSYGHLTEDDLEDDSNIVARITMDELFNHDGENDQYFTEVYTSEEALKTSAKTPEAIHFLGLSKINDGGHIWSTINSAFLRGRDMKKEEYDAPAGPSL